MAAPTARIAWWKDCEPSLFGNQTIRNFLLQYRAEDHPTIVKLVASVARLEMPGCQARWLTSTPVQVMLQGILSLQDSYGLRPLPLPHLRAAVRNDHFSRILQDRLPLVQAQLEDARAALDTFAQEADSQYLWRVRAIHFVACVPNHSIGTNMTPAQEGTERSATARSSPSQAAQTGARAAGDPLPLLAPCMF